MLSFLKGDTSYPREEEQQLYPNYIVAIIDGVGFVKPTTPTHFSNFGSFVALIQTLPRLSGLTLDAHTPFTYQLSINNLGIERKIPIAISNEEDFTFALAKWTKYETHEARRCDTVLQPRSVSHMCWVLDINVQKTPL